MPTYKKPVPSGPPRGSAPRPKFAAMGLPKTPTPNRVNEAQGPPMNNGPPPMNQPPVNNAPPSSGPPMSSGPPPMGSGSGPRPMARGASNVQATANVNEAECQEVFDLLQPLISNFEQGNTGKPG